MQNAPSHAVEAETQHAQPPQAAETPETEATETRERVSETMELTVDNLSQRLDEAVFKMDKGELTVPELEKLVADFCTYLSWNPADLSNDLPDKVESFYNKLKELTAETLHNVTVRDTSDRNRKEALNKLVVGLGFKVYYFNKNTVNAGNNERPSDSYDAL